MSFKIREIYYYTICFVTLIICIFSMAQLVDTITESFFPYPEYTPSKMEILRMPERPEMAQVSPEALEKWVVEEQQLRIDREVQTRQYRLATKLARSLTLLIITIPIYLYHWRRVRAFEN